MVQGHRRSGGRIVRRCGRGGRTQMAIFRIRPRLRKSDPNPNSRRSLAVRCGARWRGRCTTSSCCLTRRCSAITARTPPGPHSVAVMKRIGNSRRTGHQGGRLSHQGPTDGLQVARHGPAAVAATQCRTPAAARAGWCGLHRRSAAGTKHRGGSEGSRLITLIADPQLLTISLRDRLEALWAGAQDLIYRPLPFLGSGRIDGRLSRGSRGETPT